MLNDYHSNINGQSFYFVDLDKIKKNLNVNVTRYELLNRFSIFKDFIDTYKCFFDTLCELTYSLGILDKHLFDYTTYPGKDNFLVAKNGVYRITCVKEGHSRRNITEYKDVYITQNNHASLYLANVAKEIIKKRFPFLMREPFVKKEKRFTHDSINNLPTNILTPVGDLDSIALLENNITIQDLIKLYTVDGYKNEIISKPLWNIYSDYKRMFIGTDDKNDGNSILIPIDAFYNADWKAIEEQNVYSICLRDEKGEIIKGKWFNGKQKDAPYMASDVAKELKKHFKC